MLVPDKLPLQSTYPDWWALLCENGYVGASDLLLAINHYKKPANSCLSLEQEGFNDRLSSDSVVVENYFECMRSLWLVLPQKYCWNHDIYKKIFKYALAFTNLHILYHPFWHNDEEVFCRTQNRLKCTGIEIMNKRRRVQARYRAKSARRLDS